MRRILGAFVLLGLASCATVRVVSPGGEGEPAALANGRRWPIEGFVTRDGVTHRYGGFVQRVGDSLWFLRPSPARGIESLTPTREFTLAESQVAILRLTMPNRARGLLAIGIGAGVVMGVALWVALANSHGPRLF